MEETIKKEDVTTITGGKKGKRKWLGRVLNFLMYEGMVTGRSRYPCNCYPYFNFR